MGSSIRNAPLSARRAKNINADAYWQYGKHNGDREILEEELENSPSMERNYSRAMARLPRGSLVRKLIRGGEYLYLAKRVGPKVQFEYLGKSESRLIEKYEQAKINRTRYRKLLGEVRAQIKFLKKVLRGKQAI